MDKQIIIFLLSLAPGLYVPTFQLAQQIWFNHNFSIGILGMGIWQILYELLYTTEQKLLIIKLYNLILISKFVYIFSTNIINITTFELLTVIMYK